VILADRKVSAACVTGIAGQTYPGKIFGPYRFFAKKRSAKQISTEKFLEFSDFNPRNFGPANFQPEFF